MSREKLWKIFRLPSPVDLGWSSSNALPIRDFKSGKETMPTWEDWEETMAKDYPVRYFLAERLPSWFNIKIKSRLSRKMYWLKSHVIPSRRYHMLDLRQPKEHGDHVYRWGWADSDTQMVYALFNILNNFVKHELPNYHCPSEEEVVAEPHLLRQRNVYLELKAIHRWWNVDRLKEQEMHSELLHKWSEARKNNAAEVNQLWIDLQDMEQRQEEKEDVMIERLLKVRRFMWT